MKRELIVTGLIATSMANLSTVAFATTAVTTVTTRDEMKNEIFNHAINKEVSFQIHYVGADTSILSDLQNITNEAVSTDEYLDLDTVAIIPTTTGSDTDFVATFTGAYLTTKEQEDFVDSKVSEIVPKIITPDMTDNQKIQVIHQYLLDNITYDYSQNERTAYTALTDGKTVCMGYAMLLQKMANEVGIQSHIVKGWKNGEYHAWNLVFVDNKWVNIDATTDDVSSSHKVMLGQADDYLTYYGYTWETTGLPASTDYLVLQSLLPQATTAVTKAESTLVQSDVDYATLLVDALYNSGDQTAKANLLSRLNTVQTSIDNGLDSTDAINGATNAVVQAEASLKQSDVDSAYTLVNALLGKIVRTDLTNRLVAVQKEIDEAENNAYNTADTAVAKAEASHLQADVDSAQALVDLVTNVSNKGYLNLRLSIVQNAINYQVKVDNANSAVAQAESSKLQSDVDNAKSLVQSLNDGTDKTDLLNRLAVVQSAIDNSTPTTGNQALTDATNAVSQAEASKLQSDVDKAKTLVQALADSSAKTDLLNRLAVVQTAIDNANSANQALDTATKAVEKAEGSNLQSDVDNAKTLVQALVDSSAKTDLLNRLDVVQKEIDNSNTTPTVIKVTNVDITGEDSITTKGGTVQLSASATPDNATDKSVTWSSSDTSIATVDNTGLVTAKTDGSVTITATANDGSNASNTKTITVSGQTTTTPVTDVKVSSVNITGGSAITSKSGTVQLSASVAPSNATDKSVIWSSSDTNIATVSTTGLVTAKADGSVTITATAKDGSNVSNTKTITVSGQTVTTPTTIKVTNIIISGSDSIATKGGTVTYTATVSPSNASNQDVTWSINDTSVATISSSGIVTAKSNGTVVITATAKDGSGISNTKIISISGQTTDTTGNTGGTTPTDSVLNSVSISGTEEVGHTLKSKIKYDGTKPSVEYQWQRASTKDGDYSDISGATDDTYKLKSSDRDKYIKLIVTTTINGSTYDVEDIVGRIDRDSSDDSSSDSSSSSSTTSNASDMIGPLMPTNESPSGTNSVSSNSNGGNIVSPAYGRFTNPSGHPITGWTSSNGKWYYLDNNGVAKTGWVQSNGKWYYLSIDTDTTHGTMKTGWLQDTDGKWYYLNSDGSMASNATVDGYNLGSDGTWIG